jgi:hypothetical protein
MADDDNMNIPMSKDAAKPVADGVISDEVWNTAVGEWMNTCVRSSAIAQNVGAWNRLNEVLPKLHESLNNALSKKE